MTLEQTDCSANYSQEPVIHSESKIYKIRRKNPHLTFGTAS